MPSRIRPLRRGASPVTREEDRGDGAQGRGIGQSERDLLQGGRAHDDRREVVGHPAQVAAAREHLRRPLGPLGPRLCRDRHRVAIAAKSRPTPGTGQERESRHGRPTFRTQRALRGAPRRACARRRQGPRRGWAYRRQIGSIRAGSNLLRPRTAGWTFTWSSTTARMARRSSTASAGHRFARAPFPSRYGARAVVR